MVIVIPWCSQRLSLGLGIAVTGKDHILERQGWALPFHCHLQGTLVASEGINPKIASLGEFIEALALVACLHLGRDQILHRPTVLTSQGSLNVAILRHPLEAISGIVVAQIGRHVSQLVELAGAWPERVLLPLGLRGGGCLFTLLLQARCRYRIH
ncbi:hypothetical protein D3C79_865120 [compost metagenome]